MEGGPGPIVSMQCLNAGRLAPRPMTIADQKASGSAAVLWSTRLKLVGRRPDGEGASKEWSRLQTRFSCCCCRRRQGRAGQSRARPAPSRARAGRGEAVSAGPDGRLQVRSLRGLRLLASRPSLLRISLWCTRPERVSVEAARATRDRSRLTRLSKSHHPTGPFLPSRPSARLARGNFWRRRAGASVGSTGRDHEGTVCACCIFCRNAQPLRLTRRLPVTRKARL